MDEVDDEVLVKCEDDFRTIIPLRKKAFRLGSEALRECRPAIKHRPCRKGDCVDASLDCETGSLTRAWFVDEELSRDVRRWGGGGMRGEAASARAGETLLFDRRRERAWNGKALVAQARVPRRVQR